MPRWSVLALVLLWPPPLLLLLLLLLPAHTTRKEAALGLLQQPVRADDATAAAAVEPRRRGRARRAHLLKASLIWPVRVSEAEGLGRVSDQWHTYKSHRAAPSSHVGSARVAQARWRASELMQPRRRCSFPLSSLPYDRRADSLANKLAARATDMRVAVTGGITLWAAGGRARREVPEEENGMMMMIWGTENVRLCLCSLSGGYDRCDTKSRMSMDLD